MARAVRLLPALLAAFVSVTPPLVAARPSPAAVSRGGAGAPAVRSLAIPPNSGFGDQWALQNTGQFGGTPGDDVDAPRAWDLVGTGSAAVLVGSVDSGVAYDLPALAGLNLWTDPDDPPNGIDDDHDGCVDDEFGCDVVDGGGAPLDLNIHEAIASHPDTLFVAAAGNAADDHDDPDVAVYPCADPSPNVICVAASTPTDALASYSNWGARSVDLAAPGSLIAAPSLTGGTATWDGTSLSAPMVSGAAALLLAERPGATVAELKAALLGSVEQRPAFAGRTVMRLAGQVPAPRPALPAPPAPPASEDDLAPPVPSPHPSPPSAPGPGALVTTPATSPTNTLTASAASRGPCSASGRARRAAAPARYA